MGKTAREYNLMHKDVQVCLMEVSEEGFISNVRRNESAAAHFPLGGQMNNMKFREWWADRAIPKTRHGARTALQKLGYATTGSALVNNLALSLSDCYWICPRGERITWKEVNLFGNDFVDSFGELSLNRDYPLDLRNRTRFDCAASQGELQKKWCIDTDGRRYMIKGNYGDSYQQSINEVFATALHRKQGYDCFTEYFPVKIRTDGNMEGLGCACFDFCSEKIETISAWELLQTVKTRQNESLYHPLKQVCLSMGMTDEAFTRFMDYQIMTDFLLTNTDRHMNNIAVMRDPDTLELLGFAPIYDSGNSMFYNYSYERLSAADLRDIRTHSFIEKEIRLLQYVRDRSLVSADKTDVDFSIYEMDVTERHIRIPKLRELFGRKTELLREFQQGRDIWKYRYVPDNPGFAAETLKKLGLR